jgi:drug/metabolite transporter (DMT)-like permease
MTRRDTLLFGAILLVLGAGWGLTMPLTKIAVSDGYKHFGLIFWQLVIGAAVMSVIAGVQGKRLPLGMPQLRIYVMIALIGSVLPNSASYQAAVHLPSGVMSILLSMIPMWAFPIALVLALDRFEWRRVGGLVLGLSAVLLLVLPGADTSGAIPVFWVMIGLISGLFYACEGNIVARWGTAGLDPIQVLWGASIVGAVITLPLALASGQWIDPRPPYGAPDLALALSSVTHVLVYAGYVWLVGRAGPVFAVQVSYLVTLCGVLWSKLILGEAYPPVIWASLAFMLAGLYLVQPRKALLVAPASIGDTGR